MKKLYLVIAMVFALLAPAHAVLKEQTLEKSLAVLRAELENDYVNQQRLQLMFDTINKIQRKGLFDVMKHSNQIGLMLYSQKKDYTFDMAYACHEATCLYDEFALNRKPYTNIVSSLEADIERYQQLIFSLEKIPPMTSGARDSMFAGLSADSIKALKAMMATMKKDTATMNSLKGMALDQQGQEDRDACLTYARKLLANAQASLSFVKKDNEHYEFVEQRLKVASDFASDRYAQLQREIFIEGGPSYPEIISKWQLYLGKVVNQITEKYTENENARLQSEWRGSIVFSLLVFVLFYMVVAAILASLIVKVVFGYARKHAAGSSNKLLHLFAGAGRDKRICTALVLAVFMFAIALMVAISVMYQNFLVMACKLLIEYAWLLGVIMLSLLFRLPGNYIKGGIMLYVPMLLLGFLIIGLRIVFVPNDVLNVFFPVIVLAFTIFQWVVNRRFKARLNLNVEETVKANLYEWIRKENEKSKRLIGRPRFAKNTEDPGLEGMTAQQKEEIVRYTVENVPAKKAALTREEEAFTHSDQMYAWISCLVMLVSLVISFRGYTFLALQVFIWWLFQLTFIHTITSLFDLLHKGEQRFLSEKLIDAAYDLEFRLKGENATPKNKIKVDVSNMKERSKYISQTWLFDFLRICVVPVMAAFSVFYSILWAADMFNLTEFCKVIFFTNFVDVEGVVQLSIFKITLGIALFFVFKFLNYLLKAVYQHFMMIRNVKNSESSVGMFNNFSSLLVWGIYFILLLNLLQVPKSGISLVTAGLATGIGFAMKDLLENLFYGISLMSGRVRVGEWIECDGVRGKVAKIAYQSTTLETSDGCKISFLNSSLFTKNFKNLTNNHEYEFLKLEVGIAYGCSVEQARNVIIEAVKNCAEKLDDGRLDINLEKGVKVVVSELADSSVNLYVSLWTDVVKKYWVKGRCLEAIYNALNANGISIPFPQRDVHIVKD